ncbi:hypothetical protein PG995_014434 [Apiospora arundinis]|uniref:Uncharacterized protein n=1 Tax=Apiospora arundinis TaxID=335852 RepID=A0ABR2IIW9_9PEZI
MAFTLLFPTLSGSMTGYINVSKGVVQAGGGAMVPFESLDFVAYVIHDGWRVNLTGDYIISLGAEGGHRYEEHDDSRLSPVLAGAAMQMYRDEKDPNCQLKSSTSFYTWQYGFYGLRNDTTIWSTDRGQVTLPAPSLNISAFYLDNIHTHPTVATSWTGWGYGNEWVDPRTGHQPFSYKERVAWTVANQTFDVDQIVANASCQPVQNQYQWGFSPTQLLIATILVVLWTTGPCVMHYTSSRHDPLEGGQPKVLRGWRALLTLAEAMNLELASAGIEPYGLRDGELQRQIDRHIGGGRVHSKSSGVDDAIQRRGFPFAAGDR